MCACGQAVLETAFFDNSKFDAMKSPSGWDAGHCGKHQFRAKLKVNTRVIFELPYML